MHAPYTVQIVLPAPWLHSEKKGYKNGTPGVLLLQMVPFFQRGILYSLPIMCMKKVQKKSTIRPISTPFSMFSKSGTMLVPFLPEWYCFRAKKRSKTVPFFQGALKQYPFFGYL